MGVDWGDYLHNGRLSMFVTNFTEQPSTLYRNLGKDGFSDVSGPTKLAQPTFPYVGWGTCLPHTLKYPPGKPAGSGVWRHK